MFALALTPAALSLLVLAAHFLRRGQVLGCVAVLGMLATLLFLRRPWVPRVTQVVLVLAAALWALTTAQLIQLRLATGEPAVRLGVILGAVVAVNLLAALLLGTRGVLARYAGPASPGPTAD